MKELGSKNPSYTDAEAKFLRRNSTSKEKFIKKGSTFKIYEIQHLKKNLSKKVQHLKYINNFFFVLRDWLTDLKGCSPPQLPEIDSPLNVFEP